MRRLHNSHVEPHPRALWRSLALCLALGCTNAGAQPAAEMEALEAAAQRGDVQAMLTLASRLERGENVERDFARSNELYCKAAARGDTEALLKMGIIYSIGRGVLADEGVAVLLMEKAAELGNARAKQLLQFVSGRTGSVLPACLSEPVPAAQTAPLTTARKDLELMVQQWAPQYSVDPALVMALIAAESNFNPKAVSPKKAQGLMQLIPATARRFGVDNALNPAQNIEGGVKYLKHLLALYSGDVRLALAAYNAGEGAVAKYSGRIPPYPETQNYVYQVGKKLGEARRAAEPPAKKESPRTDGYSRIVKVVSPDGSVSYRTQR